MTEPGLANSDGRVLVLVATSKDAALTASLLERAGLACHCCSDTEALCEQLDIGGAAILVSEEALQQDAKGRLVEWLGRQPPGSEVPLLLLARSGANSTTVAESMQLLGNVTVLERPIRASALVSAVRTALRACQQQYQIRGHLAEQKRATETQALLAAIVASSDDAIISKTLDGVILTWNAGAERLFGYSAPEVIGLPITILMPPERLHEEPALLARLRNNERIEHFETIRVTKDGRRIDISLTVSPIRGADGSIIGASKVARDITQSKRVAEALRSVREQLQVVTDNMAAAVAQCSRDHRYLWVSRGCAEWLGLPRDDIVGRKVSDVIGSVAFEMLGASIERVLKGERVELEVQTPLAGLGPRWVRAAYVPTHDSYGEPDGWVEVITDTTAQHALEDKLRDADRRKDEFLAVLAHELRNPLAPIRNSLQVLRLTGQQNPTAERISQMMERQVNHMVRLVDDLLEMSRVTRGKIDLRKEPVEISVVLREAVETSQPFIEAGGHRLIVDIPGEPLVLEGDSVRLTQIVANLLNNAAKYTDHGGTIHLTARREGRRVVAVSVRDTGSGIAPEMLPRVFDMFTQVDRSADRGQGGLGIGLTLVKTLTEMHGGSVQAHSDGLGRGSEFVVRLPLPDPGASIDMPRLQSGQDSPPSPRLPTRRILVVDDNRDAAESTGMLLKLLGAAVNVVFSGPDALDLLPIYKPELVLLDIGMPGMDGYEVARRIRQRPEFRDVTLVALSGWGQPEDRHRSEAAGFDHHLLKPTDVNALRTLLDSLERSPQP